ncbi:MAG: hypothetical protein COW01_01560 [Bdellovibrionales bacterium CG12_big_fil_rev_8_21_14_0_65_38_15]|nr:MAG: hypothetical protein COW79_00110 [Bdellovibrionales bacterium CG22_combo_CG10-13_8_21_14_all_38_13]PIQ57158.1 MAG: hypothetical protein COW01_01560 [Bdellovibrionales bacterium CG12_big_fil_rev_8_21_14_0_65_38_15]PIR31352.1 MAG: hypothetical protein COV38_00650 [Bdellovibrionales bacterium CG11_big_fil_rev_8_21_14_0_20_38_13]
MDFTWFLETSLVHLESITKTFGSEVVFKDFSYTFLNNEKFLIKGPNGSGKTTLLEMLASIVIPCSGDIIFGLDNYKTELGFASSNIDSFFPELTGYENLKIFLSLRNKSNIDLDTKLLDYSDVDLLFLQKKFLVYSKGMKQKLNLLRALIHDPLVLICDEPLEHLDVDSKKFFSQKLSRYPHMVILASHLNDFDQSEFKILTLKQDHA